MILVLSLNSMNCLIMQLGAKYPHSLEILKGPQPWQGG